MKTSRICREISVSSSNGQESGRRFLDRLGKKLGFKDFKDWYSLKLKDVVWNGGSSFLSTYGSIPDMVGRIYTEHTWTIWKFRQLPHGYWDNKKNVLHFVEYLAEQLGFKDMKDWYRISSEDIVKNGGSQLLEKYGDSCSEVIISAYPEYDWTIWKFERVPRCYWNHEENRRSFLDWIGQQLGFKNLDDWYNITAKDILDNGGQELLGQYGGLSNKIIQDVYRDHVWDSNRFLDTKMELDDNSHHKRFLDKIGKALGFKNMEDWYKISHKNMIDMGGSSILHKYGNSPAKLIQSVYPQHDWKMWKFKRDAGGTWSQLEQQQRFELVQWLAKELKIESLDEWYRISWSQISEKLPLDIFKKYPLEQLLTETYPFHKWDVPRLQVKKRGGSSKSSQRILAKMLEEVFPSLGDLFLLLL